MHLPSQQVRNVRAASPANQELKMTNPEPTQNVYLFESLIGTRSGI
jgi:hypothetical protein